MTFIIIFNVVVGFGILFYWSIVLFSKQIPEIKTEPIRIIFHVIAEFLTAFFLVVGGVCLYLEISLANEIYLVSIGMLFYTLIASTGYFAQQRNWNWVFIFGVIFFISIINLILFL
ncbi:MAG: hypothetical protein ABFS12_13165 [Bacteroidota bacterium]